MDSNNNSANMKLEPGMMCLVIGYREKPVNVGKVVFLDKYVKAGELNPSGLYYVEDYWICTGENLVSVCGIREVVENEGLFNPKHLMPIRPEEDPLEMSIQSIEDYLDSKQKGKV